MQLWNNLKYCKKSVNLHLLKFTSVALISFCFLRYIHTCDGTGIGCWEKQRYASAWPHMLPGPVPKDTAAYDSVITHSHQQLWLQPLAGSQEDQVWKYLASWNSCCYLLPPHMDMGLFCCQISLRQLRKIKNPDIINYCWRLLYLLQHSHLLWFPSFMVCVSTSAFINSHNTFCGVNLDFNSFDTLV